MNLFWLILITAPCFVAIFIFIDRVLIPRRAKKDVEKIICNAREGKIKSPHFEVSVVWDSVGFCIQQDATQQKSLHLAWSEVTKVTAFKRDLGSTDRICLLLAKPDETGMEVHEEMNGWCSFIDEMPNYLLGCKQSSEWLWNVAAPAFEPKVTEIFSCPTRTVPLGRPSC